MYVCAFNDPEILLLDIEAIEMKIYVHQSKWARMLLLQTSGHQWEEYAMHTVEYYEMRRYKQPLHNNSDVTNIILNKVVTPTSPQKTTKSRLYQIQFL